MNVTMSDTSPPQTSAEALACDAVDPLAPRRAAFALPEGVTYLVGHSLGPAPQSALSALNKTARQEWATGLVGSWNSADWIDLPQIVGARLARLIGAEANEVIVCDSVSLNLFKVVGALLSQAPAAKTIVVEETEFPTDQYILERLAERFGAHFLRAPRGQGLAHLAPDHVLVMSLVDYRTAERIDMAEAERQARASGGTIVWDLSHATGVLAVNLNANGAQYAVGCTYKYLNGGPGAPAYIYVREGLQSDLETPLAGWLGHATPFAFSPQYIAAEGVQRFVAGTPPILSMAALNGALEVFEGLSLNALEHKTQTLGDMCLEAFERLGLSSTSPPVGTRRGGHVSLRHPDGYALSRALAARGFQTDFRTPDTIRFGLSPLILSYGEVWDMLEVLEEILTTKAYLDPAYAVRSKVT